MALLNDDATEPAILMASWYSLLVPANNISRLSCCVYKVINRKAHEVVKSRMKGEGKVEANRPELLSLPRG
jgi:hypothetical protein